MPVQTYGGFKRMTGECLHIPFLPPRPVSLVRVNHGRHCTTADEMHAFRGIPPPFLRADFCKTYVPPEITAVLEPIKDNDEAVRAYGVELGAQMCTKILAAGVQGARSAKELPSVTPLPPWRVPKRGLARLSCCSY